MERLGVSPFGSMPVMEPQALVSVQPVKPLISVPAEETWAGGFPEDEGYACRD